MASSAKWLLSRSADRAALQAVNEWSVHGRVGGVLHLVRRILVYYLGFRPVCLIR